MSDTPEPTPTEPETPSVLTVCPVCGQPLWHEKCKVVCRSSTCVYRIIYNCAEF